MTQAGAPALPTGLDPAVDPAAQAGTDAASLVPHTPLRLTIPLLLAAGWGALLTFSVMFLLEDGGAARTPGRMAESRTEPFAPGFAPVSAARAPDRPGPEGVRLVSTSADAVPAAIPAVIAAVATAAPAPAAQPRPASANAGPAAERPDYVGTWGPTAQACGGRRHGYLPARITEDGARAGRTLCRFRDGRRDGIAWALSAECSERGRRWTSQVRLLVDGDRLTWTSAKGASTYVRCGRRDG